MSGSKSKVLLEANSIIKSLKETEIKSESPTEFEQAII